MMSLFHKNRSTLDDIHLSLGEKTWEKLAYSTIKLFQVAKKRKVLFKVFSLLINELET